LIAAPVPSPETRVASLAFFAAPEPEPFAESIPDTIPETLIPEHSNPESPIPNPVVSSPVVSSPIWPIGVAAALGIALGFGAGYTVAVRDRALPAATATTVAAPQPSGKDFTEVAAAPVSPKPGATELASPKPTAQPLAKAGAKAGAAFTAGRVLVRSTPSGARIFVDGKDRGQTPATIREIGEGEHRIRIVRDGYAAAERRVTLSAAKPSQSLSVPPASEPRGRKTELAAPKPAVDPTPAKAGALVIESRPPGATVLMDGRPVGTTPMSLGDVRVGNHTVRIERDGYRIWTASVKIAAGEQNRVTASLEK